MATDSGKGFCGTPDYAQYLLAFLRCAVRRNAPSPDAVGGRVIYEGAFGAVFVTLLVGVQELYRLPSSVPTLGITPALGPGSFSKRRVPIAAAFLSSIAGLDD